MQKYYGYDESESCRWGRDHCCDRWRRDEQRAAEGIKTFFAKGRKIEWMDKTNKRRRAVHLCAVLSFHEMEITKYRGGDAV